MLSMTRSPLTAVSRTVVHLASSSNASIHTSCCCHVAKKETEIAQDSLVEGGPRLKGKRRYYDDPIYKAPSQMDAIASGPDFSFTDGRPTPFSGIYQLKEAQEHIRITKSIIKELGELRDLQAMNDKANQQHKLAEVTYVEQRPRAKANQSIDEYMQS